MKKKTASTLICQNFKIPQQTIFQDYKCSYKSGLTYFGRLYVGQQHVCFIANMFGILKKCTIQIQKIQKIQQPTKNSLLIEQQQQGSTTIQYNFSGFKSDHAYILIRALWKKENIQSEVLNSHEDQQNLSIGSSQILMNNNKQKLIDEGNVESSFFNPKALQTDKQKLCEFQLPCSVEQYYTFFLADNAAVYPRKMHLQLRQSRQITITSWKKNEELQSQIKQINALIKVNGVPFMNQAHMSQVWKLKKNQNNELFLDMVTQMADVPYSNYFVVNCYLSILKDGDKKCKMIVDMSIVFSKSTYMKGKILSKTIIDLKQQYQFWFDKVKDILMKMRKSQEQTSLKSSRVMKNSGSSDIEYQTDSMQVPTLSSDRYIKIKEDKKTNPIPLQNDKLDILNKKVERMNKLIISLLILVILLVSMNGFILYQALQNNNYKEFFKQIQNQLPQNSKINSNDTQTNKITSKQEIKDPVNNQL